MQHTLVFFQFFISHWPFVEDYLGGNIHPLTPILIIRHFLSTSSTSLIHSIVIQFMCLTVLFHILFYIPFAYWIACGKGH